MMRLETDGVQGILSFLQKKVQEAGKDVDVVVGYDKDYAIYVHENLEAFHKPPTQAKFLEQPLREMRPQAVKLLSALMKRGMTLGQALFQVGLEVQRRSQELCPVDTGALRASAYTRVEG